MLHVHASVYNHHSCQLVAHNVAIVLQWSARSFLFAFLILLESFWTLHLNFSLSRGDSSGRSKNISDPSLCVFMEFIECLEGTTKYSDILKCAQWTCIRLSTNATGATVTWSTLFCLQKLGPSFAINNRAADLILSFRRIKQHIALEFVCMTN